MHRSFKILSYYVKLSSLPTGHSVTTCAMFRAANRFTIRDSNEVYSC